MADEKISDERFKSEMMRLMNTAIVKIDNLENRFDGLENKVDGLENRFDGLEKRFDGLENRFDGLEKKVDLFSAQMTEIGLKSSKLTNG